MNNFQLVASLTPQERIQMQLMGLRPTNPADVKRYRSGQGVSQAEKIERAKTLFGEATSMGGSHEKDEDVSDKVGHTIGMEEYQQMTQRKKQPTERDYRSQINDDMNDYKESTGKVFNTDDLMSFKKPQKLNEAGPVQKLDLEKIKLEGFEASKKYLNAFVMNLQNPSTQTRLNLYKLLKVCLEGEMKYKNNPNAGNAYKQGVAQAEQAMLKNIQG